MARKQETMTFSGSLEVQSQKPIDARTKVDTKADLTDAASFPYAYEGLTVYVVAEKKQYVLIGADTTVQANWKEVGSGGGSGSTDWSDITNKPTFATVAESGSYDDLSDKPSIPSAYDDTAITGRVSAVETALDGHTVGANVPQNAVFTDTVYDDTALAARVTAVETNKANAADVYTKTQTDALIADELAQFDHLDYKIADSAPTPTTVVIDGQTVTTQEGVRYLVAHPTDSAYEEYILIGGTIYDIGSTSNVDLTGYATETYVNNRVQTPVPTGAVFTDTVYDDTALDARVTAVESDAEKGVAADTVVRDITSLYPDYAGGDVSHVTYLPNDTISLSDFHKIGLPQTATEEYVNIPPAFLKTRNTSGQSQRFFDLAKLNITVNGDVETHLFTFSRKRKMWEKNYDPYSETMVAVEINRTAGTATFKESSGESMWAYALISAEFWVATRYNGIKELAAAVVDDTSLDLRFTRIKESIDTKTLSPTGWGVAHVAQLTTQSAGTYQQFPIDTSGFGFASADDYAVTAMIIGGTGSYVASTRIYVRESTKTATGFTFNVDKAEGATVKIQYAIIAKGYGAVAYTGEIPVGGTTGQVLTKRSDADGDYGWAALDNYEMSNNDTGGNVVQVGNLTASGTTYGIYEFYYRTGALPNTDATVTYNLVNLLADYTIENFISATGVTTNGVFIGSGRTDGTNRVIVQQFSKNNKTLTMRAYQDFRSYNAILKVTFYGTKNV